MQDTKSRIDPAQLRDEILGSSSFFRTPFGDRLMVYADYTASGRGVRLIEDYLTGIQERYANTHTEDDVTGRSTTMMLHDAEHIIKRAVNGNENTCLIATGTGATGAIQKLQEILGIYLPPATRDYFEREARAFSEESGSDFTAAFRRFQKRRRPVVFVGPYEHHSNEISWRESLAEVVRIDLHSDGGIDLQDLERKLAEPRYGKRLRIGSFSAASNVTGQKSRVYKIARILHRHDALACFDFAASAPYVEIDMNRDRECYFDAIYFSPHKFLGGPGSSGILLFNRRIYRTDLPPTFSGGGTVDYVSPTRQDYLESIEAREKAGTPGTLQVFKAALALQLKEAVGKETIASRERRYITTATERFSRHEMIDILGNPDPERRIGIISFNIRQGARFLHPKFVTRLLNDLFGIQSRAGCSCAGPYGHTLLHIGRELSGRYRKAILSGREGVKPGWVRIGFHYTMDDEDVDYVCSAVEFLAECGYLFLPQYCFDLASGAWSHTEEPQMDPSGFGLDAALARARREPVPLAPEARRASYRRYLEEAAAEAERLRARSASYRTELGVEEDLIFFNVVNTTDGRE